MASIVRHEVRDGFGRENALGMIGRVYLVLGIAGALFSVVLSAALGQLFWIAAGVLFLAFGVAFHVLFGAFGEVIALLKRSWGVKTDFKVSGEASGTIFLCSECGAMVYESSERCPRCSEEFVPGGEGAARDTGS